MRVARFAIAMGFVFTSSAWAGGQAVPPSGSAGAPSSRAADSKRLTRSQSEVERLKRDLHKQESDNRQAGERQHPGEAEAQPGGGRERDEHCRDHVDDHHWRSP